MLLWRFRPIMHNLACNENSHLVKVLSYTMGSHLLGNYHAYLTTLLHSMYYKSLRLVPWRSLHYLYTMENFDLHNYHMYKSNMDSFDYSNVASPKKEITVLYPVKFAFVCFALFYCDDTTIPYKFMKFIFLYSWNLLFTSMALGQSSHAI